MAGAAGRLCGRRRRERAGGRRLSRPVRHLKDTGPLRTTIERDGAILHGEDIGTGPALVFQHGLGGGLDQVEETIGDPAGFRRLTLECRAHGASGAGLARPFSIAGFAADVLAFADARGVGTMVAGGISMGAAIAMHLAVRHPARVRALILVRPAWLFSAAPAPMRPLAEAAAALRAAPPAAARAAFVRSRAAAVLARDAPANLASLLRFFEAPDPATTAALLSDIAADGPGVAEAEAAALRIPTLVIGHDMDAVHPLATARTLAATMPGARFVQVPAKAAGKATHVAAIRRAVASFLDGLGA